MRQNLERANTIINLRNQEIAALSSRLAGKDEIIAEASEQIARLESEIAPIALSDKIPESEIDAADLLNKLKARRKKSKSDLGDVESILEILDKER